MPVFGQAGAGVQAGGWVANEGVRQAGARGEKLAAAQLDRWAEHSGGTVVHDVLVPHPKLTFNVDHVAIFGRTVVLIDSKFWKPGFYWTWHGVTRRGLERFPAADKATMLLAAGIFGRILNGAKVATPLVAVFSSNTAAAQRLWALRIQGARPIHGDRLSRVLPARCAAADERIVRQVTRLMFS